MKKYLKDFIPPLIFLLGDCEGVTFIPYYDTYFKVMRYCSDSFTDNDVEELQLLQEEICQANKEALSPEFLVSKEIGER